MQQVVALPVVLPASSISTSATDQRDQMQDKAKKQINSMVPSKRMGEPSEVADATMFLLSQSSDYINGHTLVIDGALTA